MEWTEPRFERREVDAAGQILRSSDAPARDVSHAFEVLDNWRASHAFPLNTFQVVLRKRAREFDPGVLVAQRLKRASSIVKKLQKQPTMRLSQMQDIGGCRAVLPSVSEVKDLREAYHQRSSAGVLVGHKDYIEQPRPSGYRGIHLVYRYQSGRSAHRSVFNGQQIEIQLRSQLQHAWATAVETVGTLIDQALKSSEGSEQWLDFFKLTSSLFAFTESTPPLADSPPRKELVRILRDQAQELRVGERLTAFRAALQVLEGARARGSRYFLLTLDPIQESLQILGFREGEIEQATEAYLEAERNLTKKPGIDVVLVRADSIDSLRRAYPNYFLDTEFFLQTLDNLGVARRRRTNQASSNATATGRIGAIRDR
jgi:hypothetical protein